MRPQRPNILFALADDASHFSVYGHRFVSTPAIERVAREGVVFTNAFTMNPKCAPSRAGILTGMYPWQLESACNHNSVFPAKFAVYPDLLERAGYAVGHTGKGWAPGDWKSGGFTRNPAGPEFNARRLTPPPDTGIHFCDYAGNFEAFLDQRQAGRPFCFWYGCNEPHRPYRRGEGLRAGKRLSDLERIPSYWPDDEVVRGDLLDYANEIDWFDRQLGRMLDRLEADGELDNTLVVVTSDNGCPFPRVKGQMYEQDFHLPLVAMWRGVSGGNRRVDDLIAFADFAPTFLEAAGLPIPPQVTGRSLMPLLASSASGILDPRRDRVCFGRERHDLGREGDLGYPVRCIRDRDFLYVRNFAPERWPAGDPETWYPNCDGGPTKERILELHAKGENRYYQLCFGRRPAEELYHVGNDPDCVRNLAADPAFADVRARLWSELKMFLEQTGDPRIFGRGEVFEGYPEIGNGPHSWKAYRAGTWQKQAY